MPCIQVKKKEFVCRNGKACPVIFEEVKMDCGYRADLVVERMIIVDTKTIEAIGLIHISQVLTYLRFLHLRKGLILNFNTVLLKDGIKRVINGFEEEKMNKL